MISCIKHTGMDFPDDGFVKALLKDGVSDFVLVPCLYLLGEES